MDTQLSKGPAHAASEEIVPRGTNQSGMRDANERLVLSLVRRHAALPKSDIARRTGLSAQTVSVIVRSLENEGLLLRREPVRGRVGQPSVPIALDPDGAFSLGLKIGRRSAELLLIDFLGNKRGSLRQGYRYPSPGDTTDFVRDGFEKLCGGWSPTQRSRIVGLGIAMPFEMWNWAEAAGAPRAVLEEWRDRDMHRDIQALFDFPVYLENDATAACGAELVFGDAAGAAGDVIYFHIGAFIGGGVVLDGQLYAGRTGNAGALGSMLVPGLGDRPTQLINCASLATLERMLSEQDAASEVLWHSPEDWGELGPGLDRWLQEAARALAFAIVSSCAVIDFESAVIDGWMPTGQRRNLVRAVNEAIKEIDSQGVRLPAIVEGSVGIRARELGAASLPLVNRFMHGAATAAKGH